jgi:Zn-dependent M28 family amino/carboxypeptidase
MRALGGSWRPLLVEQETPMKRPLVVLAAVVASSAAVRVDRLIPQADEARIKTAATHIAADTILRDIRALANDALEGRAPGTASEDATVEYLEVEVKRFGLEPGNPNGTYTQEVPLVGIMSTWVGSVDVQGTTIPLRFADDYAPASLRIETETRIDASPIVFVGYGVQAPEYGWDDYKGLDVRGKTLMMLVNDPAIPDPASPSELDPKMFKGRAMTYYGRWTYKFEIASKLGAAAALLVHETGPAGYPWEVPKAGAVGEAFDIKPADGNMSRVAVESWIHLDKARQILSAAGQDFDALKAAALRRDFKPVVLNARASFTAKKTIREVKSRNVIAKLTGSDAGRRDEYVAYTAHWDHLGRDPALRGDQIYNGAIDNGTGSAMVLAIAHAFAALKPRPARSVLFLWVTAEENGLLGSKYYASAPLYPLNKTLADINLDAMYPWGATRDVIVVGYGNSTLDDVLAEEARADGRTLTPDPDPEKGRFYRSDHFELAKVGVPSLYPKTGDQFIGKPADFGATMRAKYDETDYHKPSDEVKPDWDVRGLAADAQLLFRVGLRVANSATWPAWKAGTEFKVTREKSLGTR